MNCELCGNRSSTLTCDRCAGYQSWASSSRGDNQDDPHRSRKLGRARADLVELPDLLDLLARCLTERDPGPGGGGKVTGSAAPLRLEVLHLVDGNRKVDWEGEDPREPRWELTWTADGAARAANGTLVDNVWSRLYPSQQAAEGALSRLQPSEQYQARVKPLRPGDRYGASATLESWTRILAEEMAEPPQMADAATARTEASVLIEAWDWISAQQWAEELAEDVIMLAKRVRAGLKLRREYQPKCRYCRSVVHPVEAETLRRTTWEACAFGLCSGCGATYPPGPALDALGQIQDPIPLREIAEMTGVPLKTLHRWDAAGAISPAPGSQAKRGRVYDLASVRAVAARTYGRVTG